MNLQNVYSRAYASLRLWADTLDPLDVTMRLRLPPDHTHRSGEPRLKRRRDGTVAEYSPYRSGMWRMSSEAWVTSSRLETHIEWLLSQVEPKVEVFREIIAEGIESDIFCFSEGHSIKPLSLPRPLRDRAKALGLPIDIDHYTLDAEETDA